MARCGQQRGGAHGDGLVSGEHRDRPAVLVADVEVGKLPLLQEGERDKADPPAGGPESRCDVGDRELDTDTAGDGRRVMERDVFPATVHPLGTRTEHPEDPLTDSTV